MLNSITTIFTHALVFDWFQTQCELFKTPRWKQPRTCNLADDGLGDPAVVEERFDLFFHQVAVSPVWKQQRAKGRGCWEVFDGGFKCRPPSLRPPSASTHPARRLLLFFQSSLNARPELTPVKILQNKPGPQGTAAAIIWCYNSLAPSCSSVPAVSVCNFWAAVPHRSGVPCNNIRCAMKNIQFYLIGLKKETKCCSGHTGFSGL